MSNVIAAAVLGAVFGAVLSVLALRVRSRLRPYGVLAVAVAVVAVVVVMEVVVSGSAQRLMETAFLSGALVAAAVNVSSTRPGRATSLPRSR